MSDDDRAVMERLAALEAEVKADVDAQNQRKAAALAKVREQRAAQAAERDQLRERQAALVSKKPPKRAAERERAQVEDSDDDDHSDIGGAIELASKANRVHKELARPQGKGDKSWVKSGAASLVLGPIGWLYAGSLREAIPASAAWILLATVASKILPTFLLMPVLVVALPASAIAGILYAMRYNRTGKRQRLFENKEKAAAKLAKTKDKKLLEG